MSKSGKRLRVNKMDAKVKDDFEDDNSITDQDPVEFLELKQRELVTSTIDYNLDSLASLIRHSTIDMAPKYQRRFRWDEGRQSKLIESFLMNVPIPPIFLNEDDFGRYSVIDGKQRLAAIDDFLNDRLELRGLKIFKDLNGQRFGELPSQFQNSLRTRSSIRTIIILRQSNKNIKYEVFQRLNTGGVSLNAQEIRNSAFPSKLNEELVNLSEGATFHSMLGIKSKSKSKLYQEMKDVELVLRFFALKDSWETYGGGLKSILDSYMDDNASMPEEEIVVHAQHFLDTVAKVQLIFGANGAFRRWLPNEKWKQKISAPLFDAQMFSCYKIRKQDLLGKRETILVEFRKLFSPDAKISDSEFIDSIESSTAAPHRFDYRIKKLNSIIEHA